MTGRGISLRVSLTDACSLRCLYCREAGEGARIGRERRLDTHELTDAIHLIHQAVRIEKIRFTGGEPLLRGDLTTVVAYCARMGIPDISLTTNGLLLAGLAEPLCGAGLGRINISLDSLNPETYSRITRGGRVADVLSGIDAALSQPFHVIKLNVVQMRGINDQEAPDLLDFAMGKGCQIRFLEVMPIGPAAQQFDELFVPSSVTRERLSARFDLTPLPYRCGGTSRDYLAEDESGRQTVCGFISPSSRPFCEGCRRLRLSADGHLAGCLARRDRIDLLPAIESARRGNPQPLVESVKQALMVKQLPHELTLQQEMVRIGG